MFAAADRSGQGSLEGNAAFEFFMQSGLQMQELATVYALADRNQDGKLNKFEFYIAMKILRNYQSGTYHGLLPPLLSVYSLCLFSLFIL